MLFILLATGALLELVVVYVPAIWRFRQWAVMVVVCLIGLWLGVFLAQGLNLLGLVIAVVSVYRLFNMLRVGKNRIAEDYLLRTVRLTSLVLAALHLILFSLSRLNLGINRHDSLRALVTTQLLSSLVILVVTARNLYKTRYAAGQDFLSDNELPTVTVAIPARNETADLEACLLTILANNYPKLEVLVLDDCSQDSTADVIKGFAQDGVRFLEGQPPKDTWLAKNQAYNQLVESASGELVLFCGVDIRLGPDAIRSLVTTMLNKQRDMISVMPLRLGGGVRTAFIQPMRYWWELALPRRFFNRPAVLSSCWLIKLKSLRKLGGFGAVRHAIIPETYFARELVKTDRYAFIRAGEQLDVRTVKSVKAQLLTTLRTRYPQLRKRPENILLLSLGLAGLLLSPFVLSISAVINGFDVVGWTALLSSVLLILAHYLIMSVSNPSNSLIALFNLPVVVLTEIFMLHLSMYRYEFSVVEWKGRNICIPVMRTITRLPNL